MDKLNLHQQRLSTVEKKQLDDFIFLHKYYTQNIPVTDEVISEFIKLTPQQRTNAILELTDICIKLQQKVVNK